MNQQFAIRQGNEQREDADLPLAPPEGLSPAEREAAQRGPVEAAPPRDADDESWTFSLSELLIVMTFGAVGLAAPRYLPPAIVAGAAGIVTLIAIVVLTFFASESRTLRLAWWALPILYVGAATAALTKSWGVW